MPVEQEQPLRAGPVTGVAGPGSGCLRHLRRHAGSLVPGCDSGGKPGRAPLVAVPARGCRVPGQDANAKMVVEVKVLPGPSTVEGNAGSFGESGKCWVSNV